MMKKNFVFPFWRVPNGSRIIIYGAGFVGQQFLQQVHAVNWGEVLAVADKKADDYGLLKESIPVIRPDEIESLDYDYVIVALDKRELQETVRVWLHESLGIHVDKIVAEPHFFVQSPVRPGSRTEGWRDVGFAFEQEKEKLTIAFFVGNGLGDIIMAKRTLMSLLALAPHDCLVDIYGKKVFVEAICRDEERLHNIFPASFYGGQYRSYDIAFNAMYVWSLDYFLEKKVRTVSPVLADVLLHIEKQLGEYGLAALSSSITSSIHFARCKYKRRNAYTAYSDPKGLEIQDTRISIPLAKEYEKLYKEMKLGRRYITIHHGWGELPEGSNLHSKAWPSTYFTQLNKLMHDSFPGMSIIQIGGATDERIAGSDMYILGESLELIKYVLRGAVLHVDCEGGMVHLATQLGTKCAVLFGPTPVWYFGYEQNINIVSEICHDCCFLEENFSKCLRKLEKAECMESITPEMVMERIYKHLQETERNDFHYELLQ